MICYNKGTRLRKTLKNKNLGVVKMENEKQKFLNLENFTIIENASAKTFYNNFVKSSKTLNNKE